MVLDFTMLIRLRGMFTKKCEHESLNYERGVNDVLEALSEIHKTSDQYNLALIIHNRDTEIHQLKLESAVHQANLKHVERKLRFLEAKLQPRLRQEYDSVKAEKLALRRRISDIINSKNSNHAEKLHKLIGLVKDWHLDTQPVYENLPDVYSSIKNASIPAVISGQ